MPDEPSPAPSVLASIRDRTGFAPRILLRENGSEPASPPPADPGAPATKLVPQWRGNYRVLGEIARGGMGVVFKGHDTDLGRDVALKVLDSDKAKNAFAVRRFVEEAQIGGQLQHPGIVPVYELGLMSGDVPYFTMKLVKGRTLAAILSERSSPADRRGRLIAIFESVCQTVAYAHFRGVLHRDLKPSNVMVGAFGEVQVVDWGLAKVMRRAPAADEPGACASTLTVIETVRSGPGSTGSDSLAGSVMGTPAYMAPEQAQGDVDSLDERADVFSLGAILCEILTGKPPYADLDDLVPIVHAARANLEPARARIQKSGADPALIALCHDCLTAARAARPANADSVAQRVHAYLTSTEERAQKAELDAAAARIKAEEERRARRLTVALAGTIATAILLGVGGFFWFERQNARRAERTRTAVEAAQDESVAFEKNGRLDEALASARRALSLAEAGAADSALVSRAKGFVANAQKAVDAAHRERELASQDRALLARLQDLSIETMKIFGYPQREREIDAAYVEAFRRYGVDIDAEDLVSVLGRLRERNIAIDIAQALDEWGRVRRRVHGPDSQEAKNLIFLAMDLDPDPLRVELRQGILDNDIDTLLRLGRPEYLSQLTAKSVDALGSVIHDRFPEHRDEVVQLAFQAKNTFPNDYSTQITAMECYRSLGRLEDASTCAMAAFALRPNDPRARFQATESLSKLGRLTEANDIASASVAAFPADALALYAHGRIRLLLGDYVEASSILERSLELEDNPRRRADLLAARFFAGTATRAEVENALSIESLPGAMVTLMYALLDHPDPAQRSPEYVMRVIETLNVDLERNSWRFLIESLTKSRLGDWEGALAAMRRHEGQLRALEMDEMPFVISAGACDFFRATIYAHLDQSFAARECYERALAAYEKHWGGDPGAWEQSDDMRWRREAEALISK